MTEKRKIEIGYHSSSVSHDLTIKKETDAGTMKGPLLDKDKLLQSIFRISALLTAQVNLDEVLAKIPR